MKKLIQEVHRRSLWQVTGIYLAASWIALQVVQSLTASAGLPDWTPGMALVLLVLGMPITLGTAFVQEGMPGNKRESDDADSRFSGEEGDRAGPVSHVESAPVTAGATQKLGFLTWRNVVMGGIGAFALLGFSLVAYFVLWSTGLGPQGSLVAQGVIEEGDMIVLAEFDDLTDERLGDVTTDAIRVDLQESTVITVASPSYVKSVLRRMGRPEAQTLTGSIARELAQREGLKAVVSGEVSRVGSGYLLTAALVAAESGDVMRAFRVSVSSQDELLDGIDKLSQDIREKTGESLSSIKQGTPLEEATTTSLEALRLLARADELRSSGEPSEAVPLLERALELDQDFAMAWRMLAVLLRNAGLDQERAIKAATRAFELRRRLTEREASHAEAYYLYTVEGDLGAGISVYRRLLERHPEDGTALNNIAVMLLTQNRFSEAVPYAQRASELPDPSQTYYAILTSALWGSGQRESAWAALERLEQIAPEGAALYRRHQMLAASGRWEDAIEAGGWDLEASLDVTSQVTTRSSLAGYLLALGRYSEAVTLLDDARRIAFSFEAPGLYLQTAGKLRLALAALYEDAVTRQHTLEAVLEGVEPGDFGLSRRQSRGVLGAVVMAGGQEVARTAFDHWVETVPLNEQGAQFRMHQAELSIFETLASGDEEGAGSLFSELHEEISLCDAFCLWAEERGRIEDRLGNTETAVALYEGHVNNRPGGFVRESALWTPIVLERLARLYLDRADTTAAQSLFETLVATYEEGDGPFLAYVSRARASLEELN